MLIDQMELAEDRQSEGRSNRSSSEKESLDSQAHAHAAKRAATSGHHGSLAARRPVYVRGVVRNNSVGRSLGKITRQCSLPPRRSTSFNFNNAWRDMAVEQEQAVCLLRSAFAQLTADSAEQQSVAVQV